MSGLKILVSGMVAAVPGQGGATWAVLQYVLGLRELGHEVHLLEPLGSSSISPPRANLHESSNAAYFRQVAATHDLMHSASLLNVETRESVGASYRELCRMADECDLLINISGLLRDEELFSRVPLRVYLDLDPLFTQLWHSADGIDVGLPGHTHFATIGVALGKRDCLMPDCGLVWITTLQPIALSYWPVTRRIDRNALTTVANWRGYGSIEHQGRFYGQKAHSLRPLFNLPARTSERFVLALAIDEGEQSDLKNLERNGWELIDPRMVAASPGDYRRFVQGSKAEFCFAKSGYVNSRCGWFSDRSICYLASGRPVLAQETGFSSFLPAGAGLLAFETEDDVLAGIDRLNSDYESHCRNARELCAEYFDSRKVLPRLLDQIAAIQ